MDDREDQKEIKLWMGIDRRMTLTFAIAAIFILYNSIMVKWVAVAFVAVSLVLYWVLFSHMARKDPLLFDRVRSELKAERRAKAEKRARK